MLQRRRSEWPGRPPLDVYGGARAAKQNGGAPEPHVSAWVRLRLRLFYAVLGLFTGR